VEKMEKEVFEDSIVAKKKKLLDVAKTAEEIQKNALITEQANVEAANKKVQTEREKVAQLASAEKKLQKEIPKAKRRLTKEKRAVGIAQDEWAIADKEVVEAKKMEDKMAQVKIVDESQATKNLKQMLTTALNQLDTQSDGTNRDMVIKTLWGQVDEAFEQVVGTVSISKTERLRSSSHAEVAQMKLESKKKQLKQAIATTVQTNKQLEELRKDLDDCQTKLEAAKELLSTSEAALIAANGHQKEAEKKLKQASDNVIPAREDYRNAVNGKCEAIEFKVRQKAAHKAAAISTAGATIPAAIAGALIGAGIIPVVGVLPGAVIGATVGAVTSLLSIGISWLCMKYQESNSIYETMREKSAIITKAAKE
jgi:chromosome segregation ATPase